MLTFRIWIALQLSHVKFICCLLGPSDAFFPRITCDVRVRVYPVVILAVIAHITLRYPTLIAISFGLKLLIRYQFLFQRSKPTCYYMRILAISFTPVVFFDDPELEVNWAEPVPSILKMVSLLTLDLEVIRTQRAFKKDDPMPNFIASLMVFPCCVAALGAMISWQRQSWIKHNEMLISSSTCWSFLSGILYLSMWNEAQ